MTATTGARPLEEISAAALLADCGWCWPGHGNPCKTARAGGIHTDRYARAYRRGLISEADMLAVVDAIGVFESGTVLYPQAVAA